MPSRGRLKNGTPVPSTAELHAACYSSRVMGATLLAECGVTTDAVTLRLAAAADAETIAQMSRDLIESGLGWRYRADRVRRMIGRRDTSALVACDRIGTVGFALMQFDDEHAHLMLLAVRPSHQRQGVASQMMDWMLHTARVAGMVSVHLELRAGNRAALDFYRGLGFAQTLMLAGYYEQRESAIRMMCLLRAPEAQPPADDWWDRVRRSH